MKLLNIIFVLSCLTAFSVMAEERDELLTVEAREKTIAFAKALKGTLMKGMKAEGPEAAINLCNTEAPEVALKNSQNGWVVGRTSLKVRNPLNAPDAWETSVLKSFEQQASAGVDISTLEVSQQDGTQFRYMKAIPVGGPCVICHGDNLAAPIKNRLDELYPKDRARGYFAGQLRGAFTLTYRVTEE